MADVVYDAYLSAQVTGGIDLDTDTLVVMLLKDTYTVDRSGHTYIADVVAHEIAGTGYSRKTLTTVVVSISANAAVLDADDPQWTGASGWDDARYGMLAKSTGNDATSRLIKLIDLGANRQPSGGVFDLAWNAQGVLRFRQA